MLCRLLVLVLISTTSCRVAEFTDTLTLNVLPRTLDDDGDRARVIIATNDRFGDPGVGTVHVASTAGSLRDGLELVAGRDGTIETELVCDVRRDPDCHDVVTVTARWAPAGGAELNATRTVNIRTTDAFTAACAFSNRRVLKRLVGEPPAVQLAVLDTGSEVVRGPKGVALWDSTTAVAAFAAQVASRGATVSEEEQLVRVALGSAGAIGNPLVQTFTTWDGFAAARSTFELGATGDAKAVLEQLSLAAGAGTTGLSGQAGKSGPFKVQLLVVRHDTSSAVVLGLHDAATFTEGSAFDLEDLAGGSAVAFAEDAPVDHCDIFIVQPTKKVDFLWVVDDSCSMATSQNAVARVGTQAAARVRGAQLDFRVAGVSTGWFAPAFFGSTRAWTTDTNRMISWFTGSGPLSWGTGGSGDERGFEAVEAFIATGGFREDSEVHVIFLSDTRDHSLFLRAADMKALFAANFPKQRVVVSGIVCPEGELCGDDPEYDVGQYHSLIRETGGVLGSIQVFSPLIVTPALQRQQAETMNRIVNTVVTGAGVALKHRAILPSIRVATSGVVDPGCDNRDIPRSTEDGWDMDPATGRIAFYGRCVPLPAATMVVSYKSWARFGTQLHEIIDPRFAVAAPTGDGGVGPPDAGVTGDAGFADAGDGG
ncbi:MAG: hypothetical protein JNK82_35135 [Myxococcaceae bacterium]|nr:hypothetical protein [Myxococcaceae bacterium]